MIYIIEVKEVEGGWEAYCSKQFDSHYTLAAFSPVDMFTAFSDLLDMMKEELA